jgi:predicted DNA-binding transcriptional regulator YafY
MATTSSRTLRLLSLLQTHRYWPGAELADRLEVSVRTVRRDVDRLRDLGYPVRATRGVEGGYQLAAGAALPPLVVDDDEAVALAVGMQAATQGAIAGMEESAVRALTKVVQVMPPPLRRRVDSLLAMTVSAPMSAGPTLTPEVLITVAQACRDTERLEFAYTAAGGRQTDRHVEPHRLVSLWRRWYLVAYDLDRHDWRSFRLDRMSGPRTTRARFRQRELPADDAAAFVRADIKDQPQTYTVDVVVHAQAELVRARIGRWCAVEALDDERCRMRTSADTLEWPALALGMVGVDFEVVDPPELVEYLRDWGARFTHATTPR